MTRILFVDDEPLLLQGLQRMLRPQRHQWRMRFASSGKEGLAELAREPADIVISDMRMPEMDGHQFLTAVRNYHPRAVRIILSGQKSQESAICSLRVAHRQLSKPCDPEVLKANIVSATHLRDLLQSERLIDVVNQIECVPSMPRTFLDIERELDQPEPSIKRIAEIIGRDVGLTTKIMQVVNSVLSGHRVDGIVDAVVLLGLEFIHSLVCSFQLVGRPHSTTMKRFHLDDLSRHGLAASALARRLAQTETAAGERLDAAREQRTPTALDAGNGLGHDARRLPETLGIAGLLQDVGIHMLASSLSSELQEILTLAARERMPYADAERQVLGITHEELGAYLLGLWGLPDILIEAVAWHHRPASGHVPQRLPVALVHVAGHLAQEMLDLPGFPYDNPLDEQFLRDAGVWDRLPAWRAQAEQLLRPRKDS